MSPRPAAGQGDIAFSRTEIEALALKAARGAGLDWGLAEEAGKITRLLDWLGLPGPEWLLAALETPRAETIARASGIWQSPRPGLALCPLRCAACLSDAPEAVAWQPGTQQAAEARAKGSAAGLRILDLQSPGLVIGGLLHGGPIFPNPTQETPPRNRRAITLQIAWQGGAALIRDSALSLIGDLPPARGDLTLSHPDPAALADFPAARKIAPRQARPAALWAALDRFAMATTVPATETSRSGAGAAGTDND